MKTRGNGSPAAVGTVPLVAALTAMFLGFGGAAEAQELSPSAAIELATENSSELREQRLRVSQAQRSAEHTWNRFLPSLSLNAGVGSSVPPAPISGIGWEASSSVTTGIEIDIPTVVGDDSAATALRRQQLSYREQHWQLRTEVLNAYFELVLDRAEVELTRRQVEAARERAQEAQEQYENGVISEYQLLQQRVAYENQRPELSALEDELELAERAFRRLIGAEPGRALSLQEELPAIGELPDADRLVSRYAQQSFPVRRAELDLEAEQPTITDRVLPTVALSYTASVGNPPEWRREGSVDLSVSFPVHQLFPGSEKQVAQENAAEEREALRIALERAREDARVAIEEQLRAAVRAREQISVVERNLELAERAYQLAQQQYDAGAIGFRELEDAELELRQAELTVAREKNAFLVALAELEQAVADSLSATPW